MTIKMKKQLLVYLSQEMIDKLNDVQGSLPDVNKSRMVERILYHSLFNKNQIREIFPDYKKMGTIQNIDDKNKKIVLTEVDKINVNNKIAILISYNRHDFDISEEAERFLTEEGGFAWGSTINIDFDKAPRFFWCYIHEKGTNEITYKGVIDKFHCRSSRTPKIWKELQKYRDDPNEECPQKKILFLIELKQLKTPVKIEEFRKYKDNKQVHLAALRNFVWVKPI
ncbi:TPA: hypothetical protein HA281_03615 [Candidatus Woesearchaeota archaeon]|nr:hypothetical protein [Candidatus Woesearchaeota archaeon]HIH91865.1 hypothetical protein [Candidatus Woesearchaeota archaeon]HII64209.1 hypothetical protein [Candidatus Woesearchaeota archaeon]